MDELPVIIVNGEERRLGCLPPTNLVMAGNPFVRSGRPVLDDSDIRKIIQNRTPRRQFFGDYWIRKGNQKQYGSCNGWATAMALSKIRWLAGIRDMLVLAGAYVYSKLNNGQDRGSNLSGDIAELIRWGAPSADIVTADMIYPHLQPKNADALALHHKGSVMYYVDGSTSDKLQQLKSGLALDGVIVFAVQAGSGFQTLRRGIAGVDNGQGNHAIHADDLILDGSDILFDSANNWDLTYGDNGRAGLHKESLEQTLPIHQAWVIFDAVEA